MISLTNSDWTAVEVMLLLLVLGMLAVIVTMMAIPWMQEVRYRRLIDKGLKSLHKRGLTD